MRRSTEPWGWAALVAIIVFFALFFVWPLLHAGSGAFVIAGRPSLDAFRDLFAHPGLSGSIFRAGRLAVATTLAASLLAVPAALFLTRYELPWRRFLTTALLVPLVLPPFVGAIGLKRFLGRFGSVNLLAMDLFGLDRPPVDWLSSELAGVVVLQALHFYPILFLIVRASFQRLDPAFEEAARSLGLGPLGVVRRVVMPLVAPGYVAGALIVFVGAFTDVGTPLLMGVRGVVAVQIFERVTEMGDNPAGYALVAVVVGVSFAAFLVANALAPEHSQRSQKGASRSTPRRLSRRHAWLVTAAIVALVVVAVLPHVGVVLLAVSERWFLTPLPTEYSLRAFALLAAHPLAASSIRISLALAAIATLVDVVLALAIAVGCTRGGLPGARWLDALAMTPLAVPGVVLAFGLVGAYAGTTLDPMTRSPFVLLAASYAIRRLPFTLRSTRAGFAGLDPSLEEAARTLGMNRRAVFRRITLPLVAPHVLAGALLTFVFAAVEVSDSLVLAVRPEHYPMTKAIWELLGRLDDGPMIASAMGVLVMTLLAVSFLVTGWLLGRRSASAVVHLQSE